MLSSNRATIKVAQFLVFQKALASGGIKGNQLATVSNRISSNKISCVCAILAWSSTRAIMDSLVVFQQHLASVLHRGNLKLHQLATANMLQTDNRNANTYAKKNQK